METELKAKILSHLNQRNLFDFLASDGYTIDKDDLIELAKELAYAIEETSRRGFDTPLLNARESLEEYL